MKVQLISAWQPGAAVVDRLCTPAVSCTDSAQLLGQRRAKVAIKQGNASLVAHS